MESRNPDKVMEQSWKIKLNYEDWEIVTTRKVFYPLKLENVERRLKI